MELSRCCFTNFLEPIINGILRNVRAKEEGHYNINGIRNIGDGKLINAFQAKQTANATSRGAGYSRYEQERFKTGRDETAGFKIDTMGTYHGKDLVNMATKTNDSRYSETDIKQPHDPRTRDPRQTPNALSRKINTFLIT